MEENNERNRASLHLLCFSSALAMIVGRLSVSGPYSIPTLLFFLYREGDSCLKKILAHTFAVCHKASLFFKRPDQIPLQLTVCILMRDREMGNTNSGLDFGYQR